MGKGKGKNKPNKAPRRGPNQPPNRLPRTPQTPITDIALTTYELLEGILLLVDERTLLVSAQRVCTHWHRIITTSVRLQRRLFFLPTPSPTPVPTTLPLNLVPDPKPYLRPNPLLQHAFPCLFPPPDITNPPTPLPDTQGPSGPCLGPYPVEHNLLPPCSGFIGARYTPLTTATTEPVPRGYSHGDRAGYRRRPPPQPDYSTNPPTIQRDYVPPLLDERYRRELHHACARRGASWRRMLLSDPPVTVVGRVGSDVDLRPGGEPWRRKGFLVVIPEGLRMGEFYDAVFDVNWRGAPAVKAGGWWTWKAARGAWVAWRGTRAMGGCRHREGEAVVGGTGDGVGWLAGADLVLGEYDWQEGDGWVDCADHVMGRLGRLCFQTQECWSRKDKRVYQCEEYRARERLWLPPAPRRAPVVMRREPQWDDSDESENSDG